MKAREDDGRFWIVETIIRCNLNGLCGFQDREKERKKERNQWNRSELSAASTIKITARAAGNLPIKFCRRLSWPGKSKNGTPAPVAAESPPVAFKAVGTKVPVFSCIDVCVARYSPCNNCVGGVGLSEVERSVRPHNRSSNGMI
jgi:hypothetical protein